MTTSEAATAGAALSTAPPPGRVASINVSNGGVPKHGIPEARVGALGLEGDHQRNRAHHGGPERAVVLFSVELIRDLQSEGHPIGAGTIGENLTLEGIDWSTMVPGARLDVGEVRLELTRYASPCQTIAGSFRGGNFSRVLEKRHPGWSRLCAKVVAEGTVRVGDPVRLTPASGSEAPAPER